VKASKNGAATSASAPISASRTRHGVDDPVGSSSGRPPRAHVLPAIRARSSTCTGSRARGAARVVLIGVAGEAGRGEGLPARRRRRASAALSSRPDQQTVKVSTAMRT